MKTATTTKSWIDEGVIIEGNDNKVSITYYTSKDRLGRITRGWLLHINTLFESDLYTDLENLVDKANFMLDFLGIYDEEFDAREISNHVAVTHERANQIWVNSHVDLAVISASLGLRKDWHEPDQQGVSVKYVLGKYSKEGSFDNATCDEAEDHIEIYQNDTLVCKVNLALLLAIASGYGR